MPSKIQTAFEGYDLRFNSIDRFIKISDKWYCTSTGIITQVGESWREVIYSHSYAMGNYPYRVQRTDLVGKEAIIGKPDPLSYVKIAFA